MSTKMNPNMPAFPTPDTCGHEDGLTKRELIAAMAMQGLLAATFEQCSAKPTSEKAIRYADALLAELERTKK